MTDDSRTKLPPLIRSVRQTSELLPRTTLPEQIGGREGALAELSTYFRSSQYPKIAAVVGLGGMGKTYLATAYAAQASDNFPDGVFFFHGDRSHKVVSDIIQRLAPTARIPDGAGQDLSLYRELLTGRRILIIVDDIEDDFLVDRLMPPPPAALLVTCRRPPTVGAIKIIQIGSLSRDEAIELLRRDLHPHTRFTARELEEIAEAVDCHPLALKLTAAYLKQHPNLSLGDWKRQFTNLSRSVRPNVNTVIEAALNRLSGVNSVLLERLAALTVFEGAFSIEAMRAICELQESDAHADLDILLSLGFVERAKQGFSLHEAVREYARRKHANNVGNAKPRHSAFFLEQLKRIGKQYRKQRERAAAWKEYETNKADIDAGREWAASNAEVNETAKELLIGYATAAVELFATQLPAATWTGWFRTALQQCTGERDQRLRADLLYALGVGLMNHGSALEALECLRECLTISQATRDRHLEGNAFGALGLAHSLTGEVLEAIRCYERMLSIAREMGNKVAETDAIGNLGVAYSSIRDFDRAISFFEQQLIMARLLDHKIAEAGAIGNLGLCFRARNDLDRAQQLFEEQIAISRMIGDRRGEVSALSNIGNVRLARGELMVATEFFERAIDIARKLDDRWQEGRLIGNLGNAYLAAGQVEAAIDAYAQQRELAEMHGDRNGQANALWNSAIALETKGDLPLAVSRAKEALEIRRALGDPNAEKTASWLQEHGVQLNGISK